MPTSTSSPAACPKLSLTALRWWCWRYLEGDHLGQGLHHEPDVHVDLNPATAGPAEDAEDLPAGGP